VATAIYKQQQQQRKKRFRAKKSVTVSGIGGGDKKVSAACVRFNQQEFLFHMFACGSMNFDFLSTSMLLP
jgi:hypothetical protein